MFEAHGSYDIKLDGQVMYLYIKGTWNLETALAYQKDVHQLAKRLPDSPWVTITDINEWDLFTPDCKPIIERLSHEAYKNGLVRDALVSSSQSIKTALFSRTVRDFPQFERQFFANIEQALLWLASEGFA